MNTVTHQCIYLAIHIHTELQNNRLYGLFSRQVLT